MSEIKEMKLIKFSKLTALKNRWNDNDLTITKLRGYNKWSVNEKFKIIEIELRLEHYLCKNILVDLENKDDLFKKEKRKKYFSSENLKNGIIDEIIKKLKKENKKLTINTISNLSFGQKKRLWCSLNKNIFKNKFMGLNTEKEQKEIVVALENVRNIRNGIAHLESEKQIYSKLRKFDSNKKMSKLEIYKKSISLCRKIQS